MKSGRLSAGAVGFLIGGLVSFVITVMVVVMVVAASLLVRGQPPAAPVAPTQSTVAVSSGSVPVFYKEAFDYALTQCPEVPAPVLAAQIQQESGWRADAVSPVGARGLGQFMPGTWREHAVDANGGGAVITDPADNLASAAAYDCYLLRSLRQAGFSGDLIPLMLASYNAGPGNVRKYGGIPPFSETQKYVRNITALAKKYTVAVEVPGQVVAGSLPATALPNWPRGENGLAPNAEFGRKWVDSTFGTKTPVSQCVAEAGHVPNSYHYDGHACDFYPGNKPGVKPDAAQLQLGWAIANAAVEHHEQLDVVQVIWQKQIWTVQSGKWSPYTNSKGSSIVLDHIDHPHLSFDRSR